MDPDGSLDKSGQPKTYYSKNSVDLQGHIADDFKEILEQGKLKGVNLESLDVHQGYGETAYVVPRKKELQLTSTGKWSDNPLKAISEAVGIGKKHSYEIARITFDSADGKPQTVRIQTETENVIGDKFIKRRRIKGFSTFLTEAQKEIHAEISQKMKDLLAL